MDVIKAIQIVMERLSGLHEEINAINCGKSKFSASYKDTLYLINENEKMLSALHCHFQTGCGISYSRRIETPIEYEVFYPMA